MIVQIPIRFTNHFAVWNAQHDSMNQAIIMGGRAIRKIAGAAHQRLTPVANITIFSLTIESSLCNMPISPIIGLKTGTYINVGRRRLHQANVSTTLQASGQFSDVFFPPGDARRMTELAPISTVLMASKRGPDPLQQPIFVQPSVQQIGPQRQDWTSGESAGLGLYHRRAPS